MKRKRIKIRYKSSGVVVMVPAKYAEILKRRGVCSIIGIDNKFN